MKFGIVTDTHLAPPDRAPSAFHNTYDFEKTRANFETALSGHVEAGVDAIIMLGDLANNGDEPHHRLGIELCAATGLPVYLIPGNHDCEEGVTALSDRVKAFGSQLLSIPSPTGEIVDGVRIAGLPTSGFNTEAEWTISSPAIAFWGEEPVLLVSHVPAMSLAEVTLAAGFKYAGDTGNTTAVHHTLQQRDAPTIVVHGHLHLRHTVVERGTLQIGFAAIVEPPHATATLEIERVGGDLVVNVRHDSVAPYSVEMVPVLSPAIQRYRYANGSWVDESLATEVA